MHPSNSFDDIVPCTIICHAGAVPLDQSRPNRFACSRDPLVVDVDAFVVLAFIDCHIPGIAVLDKSRYCRTFDDEGIAFHRNAFPPLGSGNGDCWTNCRYERHALSAEI